MSRFMRIVPMLTGAAMFSSCTLGPNYTRPAIETPAVHRGAPDAPTASLADMKWFEVFKDEQLTSLVKTALANNFDLRIAAERVLQARAAYGITRSHQFPVVDASADVNAVRSSEVGAFGSGPPGADTSVSYVQAGFSAGWELDVWGRLRRLSEAARAQYLATEEARRGVTTTLIADVTERYLALRALDLELQIARRTEEIASDSLRLTEARRAGGVASGLDLRQAEQLLFTARAQIASLERDIAQVENSLSLLVGRLPGDVTRGQPLEALEGPPSVPAGLPSTLLERRPDIRQAEQELVGANAQIGAVKAEYFPRIALTGFLGGQSRALADLLSAPARVASATLGATVPVFNAGRTRRNVELAEAVHREALINYQRVIYAAFREVADALADLTKTREERAQQQRLVDTLGDATRLSVERYRGGLDSYLPVLDAQRNLFQGELALARLRQRELAAIVELYRALGGGWADGESE